MYRYIIHFKCDCHEKSFVGLFNYLNQLFNKNNPTVCPPYSSMHRTYWMPDDIGKNQCMRFRDKQIIASQIENFVSVTNMHHINISQALILISVDIPQNDIGLDDVFSYRYLLLTVRQLLRQQDFVTITCDKEYYNKIGSYFILETMSSNQLFAYVKSDRNEAKLISFPQKITLSPEWFPAICLGPDRSDIFEVLNNPIFDSEDMVRQVLVARKDGIAKNRINFKEELTKLQATSRKNKYRVYFRCCFERWLNGTLSGFSLEKQLSNVSGVAQLLFAAMCRNLYSSKKLSNDSDTMHKLEELLEVCCDFSDCILQVAENIVSHTNGGILSIRINNNWDKIKDTFISDSIDRYVRISLVDFSACDMLTSIKKKTNIDGLTLEHIFGEYKNSGDESYHAYQRFLENESRVIHHYGLSVFSNVVEQYHGCFAVKSGITETTTKFQWYTSKSNHIEYCKKTNNLVQIPGTEYDILLGLDEKNLQSSALQCNPSILVSPQYITERPKQEYIYKTDLANFFNDNLSLLIRNTPYQYSYQELKEHIVEEASKHLSEQLNEYDTEHCIFYFYLSNIVEHIFGRVEIIAKILLQTIALLKNNGHKQVYIVLYGLSEHRVASFVRQFALFYHRKAGNQLMKHCQIYVISENYQAEVLFSGVQLSAISDYNRGRRLVSGTSIAISNLLDHIARRQANTGNNISNPIIPLPFDLLNRMEVNGTGVTISLHNKWYYNNLTTVLNNDIHGNDLGCHLKNAHVRTEKVHLHDFFEGQLLFANTYWYQIFSHYLYEQVIADPQIPKDHTAVLLYGYETYSEQMLFAAKKKLNDAGYDSWYAIYENPKYITAEQTSDKRIRYIEDFLKQSTGKDICLVFVFGIGTTLATLYHRMYADLLEIVSDPVEKNRLKQAYKRGIVIIQVDNNSNQPNSIEIECNQVDHTVQSKKGYLDFLDKPLCNYLARIEAEWASAEACVYCFPDRYLDELPLIQTNETSTIPMLLIKPSNKTEEKIYFKQTDTHTGLFLKKPENAKYLYYTHLDRSGNHHQFYLRTASLLHDYLAKPESEMLEWFEQIKNLEILKTTEQSSSFQVSMIVSPRHFSNESFVAAVNQYVFDGKAYIIDFDVKKEFRESFAAKFRNYRTALEMMGKGRKLELNFYYVDDRIITGATFNRAKSLVSSMLGSFYSENNKDISINLFKAIIVLVNRNSKNTLRNFFVQDTLQDSNGNTILPVYRFIDLNTPSIRSYGDSCPLCSQVETIKTLRRESSLSFVEKHWRNKAEQHKLMKLSSAKQHKQESDLQHNRDPIYVQRGFRRLQCSEAIWDLLKTEHINEANAKEKLENKMEQYLKAISDDLMRVEYLISFLKVISREHIVYQENINTAAMQVLLSIFSVFANDNLVSITGLYETVYKLVYSSLLRKENPEVLYELYQIVIARLCSMGSVLLCRGSQLEACINTGFQLEACCNKGESQKDNDQPILKDHPISFSKFLAVQIKKMLFATKDCDLRVERLAKTLEKHINDVIKEELYEPTKT